MCSDLSYKTVRRNFVEAPKSLSLNLAGTDPLAKQAQLSTMNISTQTVNEHKVNEHSCLLVSIHNGELARTQLTSQYKNYS